MPSGFRGSNASFAWTASGDVLCRSPCSARGTPFGTSSSWQWPFRGAAGDFMRLRSKEPLAGGALRPAISAEFAELTQPLEQAHPILPAQIHREGSSQALALTGLRCETAALSRRKLETMTSRKLTYWLVTACALVAPGVAYGQAEDAFCDVNCYHEQQWFAPVDFDFDCLPIERE